MREPTTIAAVGMPGVGKTYENLQQIKRVVYGNPGKGVQGRKVLIVDNNAEYSNQNTDVRAILHPAGIRIKTIHPKHVAWFSAQHYNEVCRVIPFNDDGRPMSLHEFANTLNIVLNNFRNGLLVAEDFKAYTGNSLNTELIGKLATRRHSGCDTLMSLQGMGMIVPSLWTNLKWLRLHKTQDPISRSDAKFAGQVPLLSIGEKLVERRYRAGDRRFFVKINLETHEIRGQYTSQEFEEAALQYVYENWNQTGGLLMKHLDRSTGKPKYNKVKALNAALANCTEDYSQYSPRHRKQ